MISIFLLRLGNLARNLFNKLGSRLIYKLQYRDAWYFIGRKGIGGFKPIEEISYGRSHDHFAKTLDKRFCVHKTLTKLNHLQNPYSGSRRFHCLKYDGYGEFCASEYIDKSIIPLPIINNTLSAHPVYNMPIIIIGGNDLLIR